MRLLPALVSALVFSTASPALAGVFGDDLQRCLVTKMTDQDRTTLMRWMLSVISSDPQLKSLTTITDGQRVKINTDAASVIQRLAIEDCRTQAFAAVKQEGPETLGTAFNVLGQSAARQMFASPEAQAELQKLGTGFDQPRLDAFMKEAGVPENTKK